MGELLATQSTWNKTAGSFTQKVFVIDTICGPLLSEKAGSCLSRRYTHTICASFLHFSHSFSEITTPCYAHMRMLQSELMKYCKVSSLRENPSERTLEECIGVGTAMFRKPVSTRKRFAPIFGYL